MVDHQPKRFYYRRLDHNVMILMEISFVTKALRDLCESETKAYSAFQDDSSRFIARLADLRAATTVTDILSGKPRAILDEAPGKYAVDFANSNAIIFKSNHRSCPLNAAGMVDWQHVSRVQILSVGGAL